MSETPLKAYEISHEDDLLLIREYPDEAPRDWTSKMKWLAEKRGLPFEMMPGEPEYRMDRVDDRNDPYL